MGSLLYDQPPFQDLFQGDLHSVPEPELKR